MAKNPMSGGFMSRLTPRERTYVMALILTAFVMGLLVLLYLRDKALRETENDILATQRALDMVYTRGAVYTERLAEKKKREETISDQELYFSNVVAEAATVGESIQPSNQEDLTFGLPEGGLDKEGYKFNLRSVTLEDLVQFLTKIESNPGHIIVTEELVVRSPSNAEDRLNVDVTLATWQRVSEAAADEDEDEEGAS